MISLSEIKELCQLVRDYSSGKITAEEYWSRRDAMFPQERLL